MFGPSSGVMTVNNLKMGKCLAGTAIYKSWMLYHHIIVDISWRNK